MPLLLAQESSGAFLGDDLLPFLLLAMGAALVAGNLAAIIKPPQQKRREDDLDSAPVRRSVIMAAVGAVIAIWALVSLVS